VSTAPLIDTLTVTAAGYQPEVGRRGQRSEWSDMAYVITDTCTKDELCVGVCPADCIHPKKDEPGFEEAIQLYINPEECIDCGACVPVCPTNSIYVLEELPPELDHSAQKNADYFAGTNR